MASRLDVPIPRRMRGLKIDARGYPEPWNLLIDKTGKAHFTINDPHRTVQAIREGLCGICGQPYDPDGVWLVGGVLSALHEHGCYIDPPVHHQCGTYALKVCPYLAVPNWNNKTIGLKVAAGIPKEALPEEVAGFKDVSVPGLDKRPPMFVFVHAHSYAVGWDENRYIHPVRPFLGAEFWLHGQQISNEQAETILRDQLPGWYDDA